MGSDGEGAEGGLLGYWWSCDDGYMVCRVKVGF